MQIARYRSLEVGRRAKSEEPRVESRERKSAGSKGRFFGRAASTYRRNVHVSCAIAPRDRISRDLHKNLYPRTGLSTRTPIPAPATAPASLAFYQRFDRARTHSGALLAELLSCEPSANYPPPLTWTPRSSRSTLIRKSREKCARVSVD